MKKIVLIGAGGHCKVIIDIIESMGLYKVIGILDKNKVGQKLLGIPIIGDDSMLGQLYLEGIKHAFICIGAIDNIVIRSEIFNNLKNIGFNIPVLKHKTSIVSNHTILKEGTCVMPGAIINTGSIVNENCIINTGSIIEHDCIIGNNTHISPNVVIGGGTLIEDNCHIGIGSTILHSINIGKNVTVGAGAVVVSDIEDNYVVVGVPAKILRKKI